MHRTPLLTSTVSLATLALLLSGCSTVSNMKVWPFDNSSSAQSAPRGPANATEYQCAGSKHFYVRPIDKSNTVWLIYPDREVSLEKSTSGNRYTNGVAVLEINNGVASLVDGTINYSDCKVPAKQP